MFIFAFKLKKSMPTTSTLEKVERTVIHLEIGGEHHYFGSIANMYEYFTPQQLGISYGALRNFGLSNEKPYTNSKCTIRKGLLLSKSGGRGRKKQVD